MFSLHSAAIESCNYLMCLLLMLFRASCRSLCSPAVERPACINLVIELELPEFINPIGDSLLLSYECLVVAHDLACLPGAVDNK